MATKKQLVKPSVDGAAGRKSAGGRNGLSSNGLVHNGVVPDGAQDGVANKKLKIATVSHTLDSEVAERLRHFAFLERISESAVIEFALRDLFKNGTDGALGKRLRAAGAALRRRT